jgi:hypothetical protein
MVLVSRTSIQRRYGSSLRFTADWDETHTDDLDEDIDGICYLAEQIPSGLSRSKNGVLDRLGCFENKVLLKIIKVLFGYRLASQCYFFFISFSTTGKLWTGRFKNTRIWVDDKKKNGFSSNLFTSLKIVEEDLLNWNRMTRWESSETFQMKFQTSLLINALKFSVLAIISIWQDQRMRYNEIYNRYKWGYIIDIHVLIDKCPHVLWGYVLWWDHR